MFFYSIVVSILIANALAGFTVHSGLINVAKGSLSKVNGARRGTKKVNEMLSSARLENVPDLNELLKYGNKKEVSKWIEAATATGHHNLIEKLASASQGNARAIDEAFSEIISQSPKSLGSLLDASSNIFIKAASEGKSDLVNAFLTNIKYDVNNPDTSNALIAFVPTLSRAAKAANKNGHQDITKSIYYQLALNSRHTTPMQLEPIILTFDEYTQQELLLDAAAQNHFSLFRAFYYLKKDYLNYNKAIAAAAIHGNFDLVSHVFKSSRASLVYYHLALNSKTLTKETYINLILSLSKIQQKNLFLESARIGDSKLLEAFSASNIEDLDYSAWINMAADYNHFDVVIENFSPSVISKVLIWNPKKTQRLSMVRTFLQKTKENEIQERFRSNVFKEAAERGDLEVTKIFFENPKSLNRKKKEST